MDIFSTPAPVMEGPVSLPELLEDSNRNNLHLTRRLEEKQRSLDEITALLKNERNRRLTAQSSLEDANKALEELKFSHELTDKTKRLLGHRISGEICTGSDIASATFSEGSGLLGEQSVSLPDESSGIKTAEASFSSSSNDKDLQNEMESGQSFSESTATGHHYTRKLELHQMIQEMLERQRQFTKLFDDKTDAMINELLESLNAFNRLRSSLQMLGEPGKVNTEAEKYHEDHRQRELTKATHGLFREENRMQKLQVHLASLRMEQTIHERKFEQEMNVFKESAFYADRTRKDPTGSPMVFSQVNYRLKLARLIWDGAAHFIDMGREQQ